MSEKKAEPATSIKSARNDSAHNDSEAAAYFDPNEFEVFKIGEGKVNYRNVGWVKAAFLMLKVIFSLGILSIPSNFQTLGAVGGGILVVFWTLVNTYCAFIQGDFRNRHPGIHTIADMGYTMGGAVCREIFGGMYIISYVLVCGNALLGVNTALNAVSDHATCTLAYTAVALVATMFLAAFPKFSQIGWMTWVGCASIITAVFIVVVAVGVVDRPAAAPEGPYELGFKAYGSPTFVNAMVASDTLFVSSAGTSSFIPVMAEMRNPLDYKKSVALGMSFTTISYLVFSMVMYRYCGQWLSNPSLGSAGPVVKKVAYGIAIPGLLITGILVLHISAKYLFVRILRDSDHLQKKTMVHWTVWFSCVGVLGAISFVVASGIPFFGQLLGLIGSICFGPLALGIPAALWFFDYGRMAWTNGGMMGKTKWLLHAGLFIIAVFVTTVGTYASVESIKMAYDTGSVGSAFSCADDSGSA